MGPRGLCWYQASGYKSRKQNTEINLNIMNNSLEVDHLSQGQHLSFCPSPTPLFGNQPMDVANTQGPTPLFGNQPMDVANTQVFWHRGGISSPLTSSSHRRAPPKLIICSWNNWCPHSEGLRMKRPAQAWHPLERVYQNRHHTCFFSISSCFGAQSPHPSQIWNREESERKGKAHET
ncbi:hypothetical protein CB1_002081001 [Camelus ferus]|nr:hypothetical protein CB1_002081001 [Camelus ferus]